MCVYSMVVDHYGDKYKPWVPSYPQSPSDPSEYQKKLEELMKLDITPTITKDEIEEFRRDMKEMKELLKRAKEYDKRNNEPDCPMEQKQALLRLIAEKLGVEIEFV